MNRDTARAKAKELKIKGYSKMKAADLIVAVETELQIQHNIAGKNDPAKAVVPAGDLMVRESDFRDPYDGKVTFESDAEKEFFFRMFR